MGKEANTRPLEPHLARSQCEPVRWTPRGASVVGVNHLGWLASIILAGSSMV